MEIKLDKQRCIGYLAYMSVLNIRNFPPELLRQLKIQAAVDGKTVKDYVITTLGRDVQGKVGRLSKSRRGTKPRK